MKNIINITLKILVIVLIIQLAIPAISKAGFWSDMFNSGKNFINDGKHNADKGSINTNVGEEGESTTPITFNSTQMRQTINDLYNILITFGVVVSVAVGGVLGIKFMTASAEDKANIKQSLVPYIIGCVVIFGALIIWRIFINIFSNL